MAVEDKDDCCALGSGSGLRVEAIISFDERGQMVLPKEVRERAGIKPGDKFALISWEKDRRLCCMSLIRVEELTGMVKNVLGPLMKEIAE